jgi:transposase
MAGYLKSGDILVCDNAAIHAGAEILADLIELIHLNNIELRFLPAYSPEFNLAELVFEFIKWWL